MIDILLNETATLWKKSSRDVYGQYSYASPVNFACKWQDKIELVINSDGQEAKAQSMIYTNNDVLLDVDDMIVLGNNESATPPSSANNIIAIQKIKSLDNTQELVKLWV